MEAGLLARLNLRERIDEPSEAARHGHRYQFAVPFNVIRREMDSASAVRDPPKRYYL